MAVSIRELKESQSLEGQRYVLRYILTGTTDIEEAATALYDETPESVGQFSRQWSERSIRPLGGGVWECEVPYGANEAPTVTLTNQPEPVTGPGSQEGSSFSSPSDSTIVGAEWQKTYGETTRKRLKSIKDFGGVRLGTASEGGGTIDIVSDDFLASGEAPFTIDGVDPPKGGPVGYDPDSGEVAGVDVPSPSDRLTLRVKVPYINHGYLKLVERLRSCVNSEAFIGRQAGEVRFAGAVIAKRDADGTTLDYEFEIIPNASTEKIGDDLVILNRRGWDYLDVRYAWYEDPAGPDGKLIRLPERAVVHQVLPYADLNQLF